MILPYCTPNFYILNKDNCFCLVPDVEVKGECSSYYLLLQGNDSRKCKATLIYSANQINGSFALSLIHGKMKARAEETTLSKWKHLYIRLYIQFRWFLMNLSSNFVSLLVNLSFYFRHIITYLNNLEARALIPFIVYPV